MTRKIQNQRSIDTGMTFSWGMSAHGLPALLAIAVCVASVGHVLGADVSATFSKPDIVYAKTMPGAAAAKQKDKLFTLTNNVVGMDWSLDGGQLLLTRVVDHVNGRSYAQRSEVFAVQVDKGTRISASDCQLVDQPTLEVIKPLPASACAAQHLKGWQLSARFQHRSTGLTLQWRAELRDGSHYVRQLLRVEGDKGKLTEVCCLEASVGRAWNEGTAMAGNPVVSDHLFMGQELPMSKNMAPSGGVPDKWTPVDMLAKTVNRKITELKPGPMTVQFAYERGVFRIDVAEVQLVADGKVVSKDEHVGWSGLSQQANTYTLTVPEGLKKAELRVRLGGSPNDTDSFGKIAVSNGVLLPGEPGPVLCGLDCNLPLQDGKVYEFSSVLGTYPEGQLRRAFLRYGERERARPYSQFLHYNCWFDLHINLDEEKILKNVKAFTEEMTVKRGVAMESYVLDDGWDAPREGFWTVDKKKFPSGFDSITAELDRVHSHMGIWISPLAGYAFIAERVGHASKLGLVREGSFLDLSYAPYYEWFRDFCANLVKKNKVNYFKWDKAGEGASPHFMALLSCARELRQVDPNLFFNVTVGTWPSPFWLNVIDSTWRGGEDVNWDWSCKGSDREKWMNYRDGVTYQGVVKVGPLYPLNSIMNHGIVHAALGAAGRAAGSGTDLRNEARSYFGCGTALQELYIQPTIMDTQSWDAVASAAKWARLNADVLVDTHWVGGDPLKHEIYGWASWTPKKAILTLRNPNDQAQDVSLDAGAVFELPAFAAKDFTMTSPFADQRVQKLEMTAGKPTVIALQPFEVLVLESKPTSTDRGNSTNVKEK